MTNGPIPGEVLVIMVGAAMPCPHKKNDARVDCDVTNRRAGGLGFSRVR